MSPPAPNGKARSWMPMYWSEYLADTRRLKADEHGVYLLLMAEYWMSGEPLPDDDEELYVIAGCGMPADRWSVVIGRVRGYFEAEDGRLHHRRVATELAQNEARHAAKVAGANAMHAARRAKHRAQQDAKQRAAHDAQHHAEQDAEQDAVLLITNRSQLTTNRRSEPPPLKSPPPPGGDHGRMNEVRVAIDRLNELTGSAFRATRPDGRPTANADKALALLKGGYTQADLVAVVERQAQAWAGTEQARYLRPETLFRRSKFESYHGQLGLPAAPTPGSPVDEQPRRLGAVARADAAFERTALFGSNGARRPDPPDGTKT